MKYHAGSEDKQMVAVLQMPSPVAVGGMIGRAFIEWIRGVLAVREALPICRTQCFGIAGVIGPKQDDLNG